MRLDLGRSDGEAEGLPQRRAGELTRRRPVPFGPYRVSPADCITRPGGTHCRIGSETHRCRI